jgi:outer membrane lipoprotein-sorting protein
MLSKIIDVRKVTIVYIAASVLSASVLAALPTGRELMLKNEENRKLKDLQSSAELVSINEKGDKKIKQFTWWRQLRSDQIRYNTLTRFHTPAEVRDEGILFLENDKGVNDVMIYLPAYKKIRRVESQQQSGSFMGSDFSYSDIATPHVDDYVYTSVNEKACPTGLVEEGIKNCFVIESKPATDAIRERTGYSSSTMWMRPDNFMFVQVEHKDLEGKVFKNIQMFDIKKVDASTNKWIEFKTVVKNLNRNTSTQLKFEKVKVNQGLPDKIFTQQNLSSTK